MPEPCAPQHPFGLSAVRPLLTAAVIDYLQQTSSANHLFEVHPAFPDTSRETAGTLAT